MLEDSSYTVSQFPSDMRLCMHLNSKISVSVEVVSGVPQGSVLGSLLFMLYTSKIFHIVENHMLG